MKNLFVQKSLYRDLRPVSLEPESPQVETFENEFPEKRPVVKLPKSNVTPLMLFYGKIFFKSCQ